MVALEHLEKLLAAHGLGHEAIDARRRRLIRVDPLGLGGEQDHVSAGIVVFDRTPHGEPGQSGHHEVGYHAVETPLTVALDAHGAVEETSEVSATCGSSSMTRMRAGFGMARAAVARVSVGTPTPRGSGRRTVNVLPWRATVSTATVPRRLSMIREQMLSPRPLAGAGLVVKKGSKMRARTSEGIPSPVSDTANSTCW